MIYFLKIKNHFTLGNNVRSLNAQKNIIISFFAKGASIIASLLIVPITINYVNPTRYGIWLTLSSIISWFIFFDIGFGNGLKNKLAEAIADGNYKLGKSYVSTTYLILSIISIFLFSLFLIVNQFLNWSSILNAPIEFAKELSLTSLIVFSFFSFQFVFQLINAVCLANQNTWLTSIIGLFGNLLGLAIVVLLAKFTKGSLLFLCFSIGISPLIIQLIFSLILYNTKYKKFSPSIKFASFKYAKDLFGLGFKFFIIQLGLLFLYNSDNIIISQIIGPEAVTPYNIAFRYFGVITMISGIIMTPFWPAFTEAHVKGEQNWIRQTVKKLQRISLMAFILSIGMLIVSPYVYKIWLNDKVLVPFSLSAVFCINVSLNMYRTIFCYYANGVGKIRIQLILIIVSGILNIPLAFYLGNLFGVTGVILSTTLLCFVNGIFEVIQYNKLISNTASGIWNK